MTGQRSTLDERHIEYDGLALVMFACAFAGVTASVAWIVGNATLSFDVAVLAAGAIVAAGVIAAWIFGYPRHAATPAVSLVLLVAMVGLPAIFPMDGAVLREASGAPLARIYVAMGLYVGGLGLVFLAFMVFGFFAPLAGAWLRLKRGEAGASATLLLHGLLLAAALALIAFPRDWLPPS